MSQIISDLTLISQQITWLSVLDIVLVTMIIFSILLLVRDTQAIVILRGMLVLIILLSLLSTFSTLRAFSWLIRTLLPSLVFVIPVIFAPEIRRGLERLGRAGSGATSILPRPASATLTGVQQAIRAVVSAASRLSARQHGALIILQRFDSLSEYALTGVRMNATVTPELLLQIFYPNTPLHDGAVIIAEDQIIAAACVLPLSASGILSRSPERQQMGLRHRAALGISEATDAVAVIVSEQTGSISIAHAGRMIRRLDPERLENILAAFYRPARPRFSPASFFERIFPDVTRGRREEE